MTSPPHSQAQQLDHPNQRRLHGLDSRPEADNRETNYRHPLRRRGREAQNTGGGRHNKAPLDTRGRSACQRRYLQYGPGELLFFLLYSLLSSLDVSDT